MKKLRVHALCEHGVDLHPFCSGHIRLLRPLSHPSVAHLVQLTAGPDYDGRPCDLVIVERLWRPDIDSGKAQRLVDLVRRSGARLVYSQDDDIFALHDSPERPPWLTAEHVAVMELFQREAAGILVSTEPLRARLNRYNERTLVVPNALDERLLTAPAPNFARRRRLVIGYMGTRTHDADIEMIAPALRRVVARHGDAVEIQIVGGLSAPLDLGPHISHFDVPSGQTDYPLFLLWFMSRMRWDIALAPLCDSDYNRSKSDIKWLDYGALGAAGVYSRVEPYASIANEETGLLVENEASAWTDALDRLAGDSALRSRVADASFAAVHSKRTLRTHAMAWYVALEQLSRPLGAAGQIG
ncbi:MAG: hypothetical protein ABI321_02605 [Polyangia bacterium]